MKGRALFLASLTVIVLLSWANADLFGNSHITYFSGTAKQIIHFTLLTVTGIIGYYNWKDKDKWVKWLWLIMYVTVFVVMAISILIIYVTIGNPVFSPIKIVIITIRNAFTGPLPFLIFYMFITASKNLAVLKRSDNSHKD